MAAHYNCYCPTVEKISVLGTKFSAFDGGTRIDVDKNMIIVFTPAEFTLQLIVTFIANYLLKRAVCSEKNSNEIQLRFFLRKCFYSTCFG